MELRQLAHFVAVAEEHHFTRAAQRLHLAQSAVSASVRALERELDAPLFRRSTRRVELTEAGRVLLVEARRVLAAADAARDAVAAVQGVVRGRVRVGIMQSMRGLHLAEVLAAFHAAHPGVRVQLTQAASSVLAQRVRDAELDLAFVVEPESPRGLRLTRLLAVPLMLACPPRHRLAAGRSAAGALAAGRPAAGALAAGRPAAGARAGIRLAELAGESFVDFPPGWGNRRVVDDAFTAAGLARDVRFEVGEVAALLDLVAEGLGVAIVPASLPRPEGVRFLPLRDRDLTFTIAAALPEHGPPPAAEVLLELLVDRLALPA